MSWLILYRIHGNLKSVNILPKIFATSCSVVAGVLAKCAKYCSAVRLGFNSGALLQAYNSNVATNIAIRVFIQLVTIL